MNYYPVFLDIRGRRCVVVGGGNVAERKVARLHEGGALVTVVDRALTPMLAAMKAEGQIEHIDALYAASCLDGAFLAIGATDDPAINGRIFADARRAGILVNIVDDPERCDFILPSLMERGDLAVAVSTGGKSPALARRLRRQLEGWIGPEYGVLLALLGTLRERVKNKGGSAAEHRDIFEALVRSELLNAIRQGDRDGVARLVRETAGEELDAADIAKAFGTGAATPRGETDPGAEETA